MQLAKSNGVPAAFVTVRKIVTAALVHSYAGESGTCAEPGAAHKLIVWCEVLPLDYLQPLPNT